MINTMITYKIKETHNLADEESEKKYAKCEWSDKNCKGHITYTNKLFFDYKLKSCCCEIMEDAYDSVLLLDDGSMHVREVDTRDMIEIYYCPFCGHKIECKCISHEAVYQKLIIKMTKEFEIVDRKTII